MIEIRRIGPGVHIRGTGGTHPGVLGYTSFGTEQVILSLLTDIRGSGYMNMQ